MVRKSDFRSDNVEFDPHWDHFDFKSKKINVRKEKSMWIFGILGALLTIYAIASFVVKKVKPKTYDGETIVLPFGIPAIIVGIFFILLSNSLTIVGGSEVGILTTPNGISDKAYHTGWHFTMPLTHMQTMNKSIQVYTLTAAQGEGQKQIDDAIWTPTKDGIKMGFDISVNWRIDPDQAAWIYQNISNSATDPVEKFKWLDENIIRPAVKSILPLTVSEYTPTEVYSEKRQLIQSETFEKLKQELSHYKIILEAVNIREVYYPPAYETAINNKKLAEQEALKQTEVTKQIEENLKQETIKKDIAIQQAQGEAEALRIKGNSISSNPSIIALEWINKWNGELPPNYMTTSGGANLMITPNFK